MSRRRKRSAHRGSGAGAGPGPGPGDDRRGGDLGAREERRAGGQSDGRNIDPALGVLAGEGAQARVEAAAIEAAFPGRAGPLLFVPTEAMAHDEAQGQPTYYGQPLLQEPVWKWMVPAYFYVGGAAGAASVLGAVCERLGGGGLARLARRCHYLGLGGDVLGAVLLTLDLGRPERFLYMLRMLRPTSPMSVGSWVLALSGAANTAAVLFGRGRGLAGLLGRAGALGAGLLGLPLCSYTAVLLANTAVPLWQESRRSLPVLFVASAAASAGALLGLLPLEPQERRAVRRFTLGGQAAALAATWAVEREVGRVPQVARPLARGIAGALWRGARLLGLGGLVLGLASRRASRRAARWSAVLGSASGLVLRFAVMHAGRVSARDPRASFAAQHARHGATRMAERVHEQRFLGEAQQTMPG